MTIASDDGSSALTINERAQIQANSGHRSANTRTTISNRRFSDDFLLMSVGKPRPSLTVGLLPRRAESCAMVRGWALIAARHKARVCFASDVRCQTFLRLSICRQCPLLALDLDR